jgi:hypothetical protein
MLEEWRANRILECCLCAGFESRLDRFLQIL